MDDLISRDALFYAFNEFCKRTCSHINKPRAVACRACHFGKAYDLIYGMPSAQPDRRDCGWTGVEDDYPVSIREVIDITAETGALTTQSRVMELKPYRLPESKTGRWIPCSERLPENDAYVLCTTITAKGRRSVVRGYYSEKVWVCGMNSNVIAWMPLPEPYKEYEHEK